MNEVCGTCGGFRGDYVYAGSGAVICNCRYQGGRFGSTTLKNLDINADYDEGCEQGRTRTLEALEKRLPEEKEMPDYHEMRTEEENKVTGFNEAIRLVKQIIKELKG